jgi:Tol biopolymer transport system component
MPTPTATETATQTVTPTATTVSTTIAFSADFNDPVTGQDKALDLLRVDENGDNFARILADGEDALMGDWAPDGLKIVYEVHQGESLRLFTVSADGTGKTLIANQPEGNNSQPQWSPDGSWIVHVNQHPDRDSGAANLWLIPANGDPAFALTSGIQQDTQPAWSPDGNTIVFVRNTSIYTLNVEEIYQAALSPQSLLNSFLSLFSRSAVAQTEITATPTPLFSDADVQGAWPRYSPDAKYLLLVRTGDVLRLNLTTKDELNLTADLAGTARQPTWSPDGKMIACVIYTNGETVRDEIWLISSTGETRSLLLLPEYLVEKHRPVWQP